MQMGQTGVNCGKLKQTEESFLLLSGNRIDVRYDAIAQIAGVVSIGTTPAAIYGSPQMSINARDASACASACAARSAPPPRPRGVGSLRGPTLASLPPDDFKQTPTHMGKAYPTVYTYQSDDGTASLRWASPQRQSSSSTGMSDMPRSVRLYSTFGGT